MICCALDCTWLSVHQLTATTPINKLPNSQKPSNNLKRMDKRENKFFISVYGWVNPKDKKLKYLQIQETRLC
jgi:hypothetical protein